MQKYVLILAKNGDQFLVVRKHRPLWMRGRINLPGGHVEEGEDSFTAAVRELKEESGLESDDWTQSGQVRGSNFSIVCYTTNVKFELPKPREGETEEVFWTTLAEIKDNPRLMPNLKAMIPMMFTGIKDWVIIDEGDSQKSNRHTFSIEVPSTTVNFAHEIV